MFPALRKKCMAPIALARRSAGTLRATQMSKEGTNRISPSTTVRQPTTTYVKLRPAPKATNAIVIPARPTGSCTAET
ncbi:hypothetical protein [Streptomyces sp. NPDC059452]|uniref:hypothetical protein n=1 Tax=Streptomyces sp. NPDC059452 TaxID=3346835 RepID=UPI0036CB5DFA